MEDITNILQKEVSRKEFIATLGIGLASVVGIGGILRLLGHKSFAKKSGNGYGTSAYGR